MSLAEAPDTGFGMLPTGSVRNGGPDHQSLEHEDEHMRNFDFAPLYRSSVGFDQIASLMDRVLTSDSAQPTYPP